MAESIYELTGHKYREIKYTNGISETAMYPFIERVCYCLRKLGLYNGQDTEQYTLELSKSVATFQKKYDVGDKTGTLDDDTYNKLISEADKAAKDTVTGGDENEDNSDSTDSGGDDYPGAHYGSFFSEQNSKQFRQNKRDIRILLGDGTIAKVIKDVYMRSLSVEVDASGNPISETYEFIARDVCESDNEEDLSKYTSLGEDYAPADAAIKYDFSGYTNPTYPAYQEEVVIIEKVEKEKSDSTIREEIQEEIDKAKEEVTIEDPMIYAPETMDKVTAQRYAESYMLTLGRDAIYGQLVSSGTIDESTGRKVDDYNDSELIELLTYAFMNGSLDPLYFH